MKFQFIGNACGVFEAEDGRRLLCDPWLIDGVFEGSWFHSPRLSTGPQDLTGVDYLYLSHLHPDHCDLRSLQAFDRDIPILVLDHGPNFLHGILRSAGFTNLALVRPEVETQIGPFKVTLYAPFVRHPFHDSVIGNVIDSALLIEADGQNALNCNDNTPDVAAVRRIKEQRGPVDLLMLNYNAAGPYPSCFDNLSLGEKSDEHTRVLRRNLEYGAEVIRALGPRGTLPFAGSYVLGGSESRKNGYLGTCSSDEAARFWRDAVRGATVVVMSENQVLELETLTLDTPYVPVTPLEEAQWRERISSARYPHQDDSDPDESTLVADLGKAASLLRSRLERFGFPQMDVHVYIDLLGRLTEVYPEYGVASDPVEPFLICRMDPRLLRRILSGRAHWNNAEIGAHIDFVRVPNTYVPDLHTALSFLHLEHQKTVA